MANLGDLLRKLFRRSPTSEKCCNPATGPVADPVTVDGVVYEQTNTIARADCCVWDRGRGDVHG